MARPCPKDKFSGGPMKLSTRILIAFLIIILVPVALTFFLMFGVAMFQGERLLSVYGIDVMNLTNEIKILLIDALFCMICILVITGIILGFWLVSGISSPIENLTKATKNIRDGNLDFEVKVEGVQEIQELCKDFEEMRVKLKLANEEKLEADRQNRELISNISHDLKTPITAVKGYVEGIMDGVADTPEKMDRYIRTIYNKANEMDRLINELTFYSKINTNRIPYNFNKVNVREYFDDAAEELEYDLTAKNVEFEYQNAVAPEVMVIADVENAPRHQQHRRQLRKIYGQRREENFTSYKRCGRRDRGFDHRQRKGNPIEGYREHIQPLLPRRYIPQLRAGRFRHRAFHREEDYGRSRRPCLG